MKMTSATFPIGIIYVATHPVCQSTVSGASAITSGVGESPTMVISEIHHSEELFVVSISNGLVAAR
jgi:hypothetical protein